MKLLVDCILEKVGRPVAKTAILTGTNKLFCGRCLKGRQNFASAKTVLESSLNDFYMVNKILAADAQTVFQTKK